MSPKIWPCSGLAQWGEARFSVLGVGVLNSASFLNLTVVASSEWRKNQGFADFRSKNTVANLGGEAEVPGPCT